MQGILAVDPSWRGMAFALYCGPNVMRSGVMDIAGDTKRFDVPVKTAALVSEWVHEHLVPSVGVYGDLFDCIVMENQFHVKMKYLQFIVAGALLAMWPHCKLYFVSALTCKRHFGLDYVNKSHNQNKKIALKYVQDHATTLLSGTLHRDNDNCADAILLLNYRDQLIQRKYYPMSTNAPPRTCPKCTRRSVFCNTTKKPGPNVGRNFLSCINTSCDLFVWVDEMLSDDLDEHMQLQQQQKQQQKPKRSYPPPLPRPTDALTETQQLSLAVKQLSEQVQLILEHLALTGGNSYDNNMLQ